MQSADLNLTTNVTGHQRFLFIKLPAGDADAGLAEGIGLLGDGMENMHYADGPPSAEAFQRGRFQILRAERAMSRDRELPHPAMMDADGLIRLEAEGSETLLKYEEGLRALLKPAWRQSRNAVGCTKTSQLYQPRYDPIRLCPRSTARPRKRSFPGRGYADEQGWRMVGNGLDAQGKFLPAPVRRQGKHGGERPRAGGGCWHSPHNPTIGPRPRRLRQERKLRLCWVLRVCRNRRVHVQRGDGGSCETLSRTRSGFTSARARSGGAGGLGNLRDSGGSNSPYLGGYACLFLVR